MKLFYISTLIFVTLICFDPKPKGGSLGQMHASAPATTSEFTNAAARNALLSNSLEWTFGSKQQHGWYLYLPLIRQTLNNNQDVQSVGFAKAVAMWQKKNGLPSTGVLDDTSLYALIKLWQGARLKDRSIASADQLVTAPISEFYDPTRAEELRKVERSTYAAYKRLVAGAVADKSLGLASNKGELGPNEKFLKIVSAFRSRDYQDKLRRESPNSGSAGLAVNSPHFTGRALDLYVGGEPVDTRDPNRQIQINTRVYQWLVKNADKYGFRPYFYEPWHWEYVGK
ncbi:MAG TPA: D-alanyl-D-alanine carboxypeptidase family protein [Pyrinomonadaceae bacterium]|nr:D-alanyl-D-alanine carboxypeptidase family protein [Pyrinomonadaceae bacterium]